MAAKGSRVSVCSGREEVTFVNGRALQVWLCCVLYRIRAVGLNGVRSVLGVCVMAAPWCSVLSAAITARCHGYYLGMAVINKLYYALAMYLQGGGYFMPTWLQALWSPQTRAGCVSVEPQPRLPLSDYRGETSIWHKTEPFLLF